MKNTITVGAVCVVVLAWSVFSVTGTSLQFPEPMQGYDDERVGYDDLPPSKPAAIDLGVIQFGSRPQKLSDLPTTAEFDGFEVAATLKGIASKRASLACIAIGFTRRSKQEHQLIASHSEFFELQGEELMFRLPIRFPDYDDTMELFVVAIILDEEGVPVASEFVLASGNCELNRSRLRSDKTES